MKRVVVTGMGAITPIGNNVETFWENVEKGANGIGPINHFDTEEFKSKIAAEVKDFNPADYIDKKEAKRMSEFSQFAVAAALEAWNNSGLNDSNVDPERVGTYISSGVGGLSDCERDVANLVEKGPRRVSPLFIPMMIGNMASGNTAIALNAKGPCMDIVSACASSNNSIGEAFYAIKAGRADVILAGGAESAVGRLSIAGFSNLRALSTSNNPNRASIPFDKERCGFVMGEGAGVLVLEDLEHALKRGATIYGEVVGYATTCDAFHITAPSDTGEQGARAMKEAIQVAGIEPKDISYINAHGTSTPLNDKSETLSIKNVFGDYAFKVPVSASKSMFGHLLGAAGAVEAIVCIKSLEDGFIPPTINYEVPDEECDLDVVPNKGRKADLKYALSNSLGFGGHNACLVFKKWEGQ
ncbi:beta-ketoacyl-[acyl-carrier-protein] synthase II [endosymbiont 'TC1' of Trimyema compressum]|uniref:beta-ketoacyl-ACP synthase II n=1 Tax=endosymbiont 'TC1' of Trimyema compressum TaxID=243899 RepID=UPI0007F0EE52|nr:beta-ketoacyl-ACP synthase II [endosymbiont 'TC1' of Trimyema compressum]AMP21276.1 beta-ketoacyl-[acyl-carrier-protein] synthase II [endosymbiont 'TC1' of Trimyema compressum]